LHTVAGDAGRLSTPFSSHQEVNWLQSPEYAERVASDLEAAANFLAVIESWGDSEVRVGTVLVGAGVSSDIP
jgi:hypothetical protein